MRGGSSRGGNRFLVLQCFAVFGLVQLLVFIKVFWAFVNENDVNASSLSLSPGGGGGEGIRAGWLDGGVRRGGHGKQAYEVLSAAAAEAR